MEAKEQINARDLAPLSGQMYSAEQQSAFDNIHFPEGWFEGNPSFSAEPFNYNGSYVNPAFANASPAQIGGGVLNMSALSPTERPNMFNSALTQRGGAWLGLDDPLMRPVPRVGAFGPEMYRKPAVQPPIIMSQMYPKHKFGKAVINGKGKKGKGMKGCGLHLTQKREKKDSGFTKKDIALGVGLGVGIPALSVGLAKLGESVINGKLQSSLGMHRW